MKYRTGYAITILMAISFLAACSKSGPSPAADFEYQSIETTVSSRGVPVPVTYVHPIGKKGDSFPLVVMAHGHGGTRNEAGGFTSVAEGLAARGVASIRMDFPGCGESTEPFTKNNLSNMLADIQASRDFALTQSQVDGDRVGLFGFSMGGRLVLMLSSRDPGYKTIATWAPAGANGADNEVDFLGGSEAYRHLRDIADAQGSVPFTTQWGQDQQLGAQWFKDLEESNPLDSISHFKGTLFVLYGDLDDVVPPRIPEAVIAAATASTEVVRHVVVGAGHGLGLFNDKPALSKEAVDATVDFLSTRL